MISLRYGSVPVTSYVGGLVDTVVDVASSKIKGNSIVMGEYSVGGLLETIDRAMGVFNQKDRMRALIAHGMGCRWTWEASAKRYAECYQECSR
jgi:starch synthase